LNKEKLSVLNDFSHKLPCIPFRESKPEKHLTTLKHLTQHLTKGVKMTNKSNNTEPVSQNSIQDEPLETDTDKTQPKLSPIDEGILMVAERNPDLNNHQIGKKCKSLGIMKNPSSVYKRLKKSTYLSAHIDEIKKNHAEFMTREIVPEALKVHKRVLKDRTVPDKQKTKWVEMAEKAEFKTESPQVPRTVNIAIYEKVQQNLLNVCRENVGITDGEED